MIRPSQRNLQQRLADGVVIGAEGYVFELERRGYIKAGPFVPEVILDAPGALRQLHREFLRAGADVMVALTYYAHRDKLEDVGRAGDLEAMNRQAVRIANEIAAEGGALVAGNICNTWSFDPAEPASAAVVRAQYEEQLGWAVEEGVDFVIAETNDYVGEALIGLEVCHELGLPAMVTFASVQPGSTYDGYDYVDACRILADRGAAVVGLNCSRGPRDDAPAAGGRSARRSTVPVAAQPVPFRTSRGAPAFEALCSEDGRHLFPLELEPFQCTRFEMADFARRARDVGADYIGICCGGAPHHVRAMAEALGRETPASRYSPALELHSVLGTPREERRHEVMGGWSGGA